MRLSALSLIAAALLAGCQTPASPPASPVAQTPAPSAEQCARSAIHVFPEDRCEVESEPLVSDGAVITHFLTSSAQGRHGTLSYSVSLSTAAGTAAGRIPAPDVLTQTIAKNCAKPADQPLAPVVAGSTTYIAFSIDQLRCFSYFRSEAAQSKAGGGSSGGTFCDQARTDAFTAADMANLAAQVKRSD